MDALPSPSFPAMLHRMYVCELDRQRDSYEHVVTEHLRMSGIYWGLAAMETLGCGDDLDKREIMQFVQACKHTGGGYSGNVGHDPHLLYTLSALQLFAMCDAMRHVEVDATAAYVRGLQRADGSFAGDEWGEVDTRFSYCALQAMAILGRLHELDVPAAVRFIVSCRNFDGGFGAVPGAESHAGQVFCCVGALSIAGGLAEVDADTLGHWLAERQVDSGGLNGRPEKQSDVCYSWWILSSLCILGRTAWIDGPALARFILRCQDTEGGGIADRPGNQADVFHTYFGIAGLSLLDALRALGLAEEGSGRGGSAHTNNADLQGLGDSVHCPIDPIYALPMAVTARMGLPRNTLPLVSPVRPMCAADLVSTASERTGGDS